MNRDRMLVVGSVLFVVIVGAVQFFSSPRNTAFPSPPVFEASPAVEQNNTPALGIKEITVSSSTRAAPELFLIVRDDTIISWNFKGAYADNPELIAKAKAEIKRLSDLVGKGTYSDMTLSVSIANQYELLGDGKQEYGYLSRAIKEGGTTSGLPWHNLGVLMERLGAYETARTAYEKATVIQPQLKSWQYSYLEFLVSHMKNDTAGIEKAFATAEKSIGQQDAYLLRLRSEWQQS